MDDLRIVSPFHAFSGYAKMGRAVLSAARLAGFRVSAVESDYRLKLRAFASGKRQTERVPLTDKSKLPECQAEELREAEAVKLPADAPTLFVQLPVQLGGWSEFSQGPRLGWTMIESDTIHPLWARQATNVDHLLLPSAFCLETFKRAIPAVSMEVLPLPVDTRLYAPEGLRAAFSGRPDFLFFSCFHTCERKGWRLLMQALTEEFPGESVGLVVLPSRAEEVLEFAASCANAGAWIMVIEDWVSEEDLAGLYRACDAFALPSAEGFGLPFVEAALCGKPSVALDLGGAAEMVNRVTGYPIEAHLSPCIGHLPPLYDSRQQFPTATMGAVRSALRACVRDRALRGEWAEKAALSNFTPEAIGEGLREAVEQAKCRYSVERSVWQGADLEEVPEFVWVREMTQERLDKWKTERFEGFVVLISDTVTIPDLNQWWIDLSKVFALRPDVGVLAPKILLPWSDEKVRIGVRLLFDGTRQSGQLNRKVVLCDTVSLSCMAIRPEVWQNLEIDPELPYFYADADICVQARRMGWEVAATATATVTESEGAHDKDYLEEPERKRFLRKWRGDF